MLKKLTISRIHGITRMHRWLHGVTVSILRNHHRLVHHPHWPHHLGLHHERNILDVRLKNKIL